MVTDEQVKAAMRAWNKGSYASDKDAMRAALEAANAAAWSPIEEAPKDGTPFVGYLEGLGGPALKGMGIWWFSPSVQTGELRVKLFGAGDFAPEDLCPTHFRPLPEPPK